MIFLNTFLQLFPMSCHTELGHSSLVTLNSAKKKTASSSSVKTILEKTFAGSPVNANSTPQQLFQLGVEKANLGWMFQVAWKLFVVPSGLEQVFQWLALWNQKVK